MLALNLNQIRTAQEHREHTYAPGALASDRTLFRVVAPVHLTFDVFKDKRRFRLIGRVVTTLELPCSRCTEPFSYPVDASFDLQYLPRELNTGEGEREIEEEDLSTAYYEDDVIDVGQLLEEQFYLALPMKPLCGDACLGLCPHCGTNLNRTTCGCRRTWEDPRLDALRALQADQTRKH